MSLGIRKTIYIYIYIRDHSENFFQPLNFSRNQDFTGVRFILLYILYMSMDGPIDC